MAAHEGRVLVTDGHVDRAPHAAALLGARDQRGAGFDGLAERTAELRVQDRGGVLQLAVLADDGRLAVALRRTAKRGGRTFTEHSAELFSDGHERPQVIDEAAGEPVTAIACDTKPLAERALAARAGLGWIGKHTNLISPVSGSFVFLGEIVTSLALPADEPLRKTCGSCSRCVEVCPTGALRGDYTMDATRCISDLTQRTDAIPRAMRPLIGTWVWGCDLCQEACPPTMRAPFASGAEHAPSSRETSQPSLLALLALKSGQYRRLYRQTAMGWRGAALLRRNAAVALGNTLDRSCVGALSQALAGDPHPMVRSHVAWALGRIGSPAALAALRARRPLEGEAAVCEEIDLALEPFAARGR